jgi:hypothetical protein
MFYKFILALCLLSSSVYGGIIVNDSYEAFDPIIATCDVEQADVDVIYEWQVSENVKFQAVEGGSKLFIWAKPGKHTLDCVAILQFKRTITILVRNPEFPNDPSKAEMKDIVVIEKIQTKRFKKGFEVKGTIPVPPTPDPEPDPQPDPQPDPEPQPDKDPIPEPGFSVIIIEETKDRETLSKEQVAVLQSTKIQSLVKSYGGDFRQTDDDSPLTYENPKWAKAIQRERQSLPWIIVSNDKKWYEGPLPKDLNSAIKLIETHKPEK